VAFAFVTQASATAWAALIALDGCGSTVARDACSAGTKQCPVMAVKVYLGCAQAAHSEMTYDGADAFSVTAGGSCSFNVSTRENRRIWRCSRPARGSTRKSFGSRRQTCAARIFD